MFDREQVELLKDILCELRSVRSGVEKILFLFSEPISSVLTFKTKDGKDMPLTVKLTDTPGVAKYQEFNAEGAPVGPVGTVQYASDNEAVATVDPNTGQLAYLSVGSCNIAGGDSGVPDGLPASDVLTIVADTTPTTSTLTLTPGVPPAGASTPAANAAKAPLTPGKKV
jgi:hypothetical protein